MAMASLATYEESVRALPFEDRQLAALLARDPIALGEALDGRAYMVCAVCTPDDDEHQAVPDDEDKDGDMIPDDDESPASG